MTDSKVFQITEGINGKFEIKYIQFGKKNETIWQKHNKEIVGTLSGQLNEPKRMEALKMKGQQNKQIRVQDMIIKNLTKIKTDVNTEIAKINETQIRLDTLSANHNTTLTKLSTPPNWVKNHSKLDPLKDTILQQINYCNEIKLELNKSKEILLELMQNIDISIQRLKDDVISNSTNQTIFKNKPNEYATLLKNQIDINNDLMKKLLTAPEIKTIVEEFLQKLRLETVKSSPVIRSVSIAKPISISQPLKAEPSTAVVTSINNESNLQVDTIHLNNTNSKSKPLV